MKINHFTHKKLKPTKKHDIDFDPSKLVADSEIPEESKKFVKKYQNSKKLSDEFEQDLMIGFEDRFIYGFDYLYQNDKIIIPELNPVMIFYSNAEMSHRKLIEYRKELLENSPTIKNYKKSTIDPNKFGNFFRMASNCIINLQSTLESFVNRTIPEDRQFIDKNGEKFDPTIFHKLDKVLPDLKGIKFKKHNYQIRKLIELRNEIIHLKPAEELTNTKYKIVYRRMLKFDYTEAILAVGNYVNFYEPNLIEECICGREFYFDMHEHKVE